MHPVNPAKERIIYFVNQWLIRSGLTIEQVLARMQSNGYDISRNTFENRFTTRVQQKPNIPPDCFLALVRAFTERLTDAERCTASEALELANLTRLPIDQFQDIQQLFPPDEFLEAFEQFVAPLFGKNFLLQFGSTGKTTEDQVTDSITTASYHPTANHGRNGPSPATVDIDSLATEEWEESPDVTSFYGRQAEMERLIRWIQEDSCRIVALFGMGGMGKTTLAKKVAEEVQPHFDFLYWRTLRNAPALVEVVDECLHFLSSEVEIDSTTPLTKRISILLRHLRLYRCLVIFDGAEAIFEEGNEAGDYLAGYEAYQDLFRRLGDANHNSCLILTSREKPSEFGLREDASSPVRSLTLSGMSMDAARLTLHDKGLYGDDTIWEQFISGYSGNPLALKLASEPISEIYGGDIGAFLNGSVPIFTGLRELLDTQFSRLTLLERSILYWLAIGREATTPDTLLDDLAGSTREAELLEALRGLRRRSLIEQNSAGLILQHVVMEYMTERFVALVADEIEAEFPMLLASFALMKARAKEYIRRSQIQLILQPIITILYRRMGPQQLNQALRSMLHMLQSQQIEASKEELDDAGSPTYAAGNLLNLLIHLGTRLENFNLHGIDLSGLSIQHGDLRGITLHDVNLSGADCTNSVFTHTFSSISTAQFSPDGNLLALGEVGGAVRIWDVATRRQLSTLMGHNDLVWAVAFHPSGTIVASCSEDQTIRLWDVFTGDSLEVLQGHTGWVKDVTFNHDGSLLASCGNDGTVRIWDTETSECISTFLAHEHWVWSIDFHLDDRFIVSAGHDGLVKVWEWQKSQCTQSFNDHNGPVRDVQVSPDGQWLATAGFDQTVQLRAWSGLNDPSDTISGESISKNNIQQKDVYRLTGHENQIWSIAFSPDSQILASGSDDQSIRLWRLDTRKPLRILRSKLNRVWTVEFSPDSRTLVSGSDDQTLSFWDVATGRATQILEGYSNQIWSVDYCKRQQLLASAGDDKRIYLWSVSEEGIRNPEPIMLLGHTDRVRSIAFCHEENLLLSGGDDHLIRLWNLTDRQNSQVLSGHANRVWSVAFSTDGRTVASGSEDGTIRLWRIPSGRCYRIIQANERIWSVAFSPDNQSLVSASDEHVIRLWDVKKGYCIQNMAGHEGRVWSVKFSVDGKYIVSGGDDQTIRIWETETGDCVRILEGHEDLVLSVACSPCGRYIASGSDDRSVRVWDQQEGTCLQIIEAHKGSVRSVQFSHDGMVFSGGSDEFVRLWDWQSGECIFAVQAERPYQRMNISHISGLTQGQIDNLRQLGAVEE
ncbi:MAG: NB-ARC domain-containing protein [Chloroflexota bacterium]